jgi:hypothetical protein
MKRLAVLTLLVVFVLGVTASGVLAAGPNRTQMQEQVKEQVQAGECVGECDGPNCDGDCLQNCCRNQNQTGTCDQEGSLIEWILQLLGAGPYQGSPGPFWGGWR